MYTRRRKTSKRPQQAQRCSSGAFVFGSSWWVEAGSEIEGEELQKCVLKSHHQQVEGASSQQKKRAIRERTLNQSIRLRLVYSLADPC